IMDAIREIAGLPFILKGVATAEDAVIAVEHGVDAIYISNHGGRQLDHGRATIEMLPEIVEAIGGRAEIVLDGGIVRGSDVVKASRSAPRPSPSASFKVGVSERQAR